MDKINPALFLLLLLVVALMAVGTVLFQRIALSRGQEIDALKSDEAACKASLSATAQQLESALTHTEQARDDVRKYDSLYVDVTAHLANVTLTLNDTRRLLDNEKLFRQRVQQEAAALQSANTQLTVQIGTLQQKLKDANAATLRCQNTLAQCRAS